MARKKSHRTELMSGILLGQDLGTDIARQMKQGGVPNGDYVSEIHRRLAKAETVPPLIRRHAVLTAIDTIELAMGWA